jgi:hypothetical protein
MPDVHTQIYRAYNRLLARPHGIRRGLFASMCSGSVGEQGGELVALAW